MFVLILVSAFMSTSIFAAQKNSVSAGVIIPLSEEGKAL